MLFIDFPNGLILLLAGTDDGSIHFIKLSTCETIYSMFEVYSDPIVGMAANRVDIVNHPTTESENGEEAESNQSHSQSPIVAGARTRLLVCDCQTEAKLWDISGIKDELITDIPCIKSWEPHPGGTTTDVIAVDDIHTFMTSSDTGEITVWSTEGELMAKFAQRKNWPIADPRTSSRNLDELEFDTKRGKNGANSAAAGDGGVTDSDDSSESAEDEDLISGLSTRRGSVIGSGPSSRIGSGHHNRRHGRRRKKVITPPRKELSFAETHPMYIPKDECEKYLHEYAQQTAQEAQAAAKERAAEKERFEKEKAGKNSSSKPGLAEMLSKLEADLKLQHERAIHSYSRPPSLDTTAAVQGAHVYERYDRSHSHHHNTGSSISSSMTGASNAVSLMSMNSNTVNAMAPMDLTDSSTQSRHARLRGHLQSQSSNLAPLDSDDSRLSSSTLPSFAQSQFGSAPIQSRRMNPLTMSQTNNNGPITPRTALRQQAPSTTIQSPLTSRTKRTQFNTSER